MAPEGGRATEEGRPHSGRKLCVLPHRPPESLRNLSVARTGSHLYCRGHSGSVEDGQEVDKNGSRDMS